MMKSSSSEVTINSDKDLSDEQTENQPSGGSASGRSWYFSSRAMSSSTGNADTEPLLSVHLYHQLQENTFKRESQSPF